jgi:hypothetical protein
VSASTGLLAFILFMPGIFVEHSCLEEQKENLKSDPLKPLKKPHPKELLLQFSSISVVDGQLLKKFEGTMNATTMRQRPNFLATIASTYNFFSFLFNFVLLET